MGQQIGCVPVPSLRYSRQFPAATRPCRAVLSHTAATRLPLDGANSIVVLRNQFSRALFRAERSLIAATRLRFVSWRGF
jgi:hypothetical protein